MKNRAKPHGMRVAKNEPPKNCVLEDTGEEEEREEGRVRGVFKGPGACLLCVASPDFVAHGDFTILKTRFKKHELDASHSGG